MRRWPRLDPPVAAADAVIALSSDVVSDSTLDEPGAARLRAAVAEAARLRAPLLTTRVERDRRSSDLAQRLIVERLAFRGEWHPGDRTARSTHDEAVEARTRVPARGHLVVVTSPLHTRRACAVFESQGFQVACHASRERDPWVRRAWLFGYELLAWADYRRRGWLD